MKKTVLVLISFVLLAGLFGCQEKERKSKTALAKKQADLKLNCVAKFLTSDDSWYLTEQSCELFFEPAAMNVTANEPSGQVVWLVSNEQVAIQTKPKVVSDKEIFDLMTNDAICRSLLGLYLAELKASQSGGGQGEKFTFEGQVYDFVRSAGKGINLYKKGSAGRADLAVAQGKKRYVLNAYNYLKLERGGYFPSKIDVYAYGTDREKRLIAQYICRVD